jgi:S1-C subfamily serine protease
VWLRIGLMAVPCLAGFASAFVMFSAQQIISARGTTDNWKPTSLQLVSGSPGAQLAHRHIEASHALPSPKPVSSGSGFFVSYDGDLITDNHVVAGCRELRVVREGKSNTARVIGTDGSADLAVLRAPILPETSQSSGTNWRDQARQ